MDRLIEAVAAYLCRHKSVGLLRLILDLARRRLAEVGTVEVVRDAAAKRRYTHCARGRLVQYVREAEAVN
jgi:hypothetical protein